MPASTQGGATAAPSICEDPPFSEHGRYDCPSWVLYSCHACRALVLEQHRDAHLAWHRETGR